MSKAIRLTVATLGLIILAAVFLFQQFDYSSFLVRLIPVQKPDLNVVFIINKTTRLILNDLACLALILAIFSERKYLQVAFYVFLFEVIVILPMYFVAKLSIEGDSEISSPFLSMIHRLIINPTLMILLIAGFFYQKHRNQSG